MIRGKKVDLVGVSATYLPFYQKWINDPEVADMLGNVGFPISEAREREWLEEALAQKRDRRTFTVLTKHGDPIGNAGFNHIDYQNKHAVLGIMIGEKRFWDKGYGTDTILTLLKLGFEELDMMKIELAVYSTNKRAVECYKKCGFVVEGRLRKHMFHGGTYHDDLRMGILREEWERKKKRETRARVRG